MFLTARLKKSILVLTVIGFALACPAQEVENYKALDVQNPIVFGGDYIEYNGLKIDLGPHSFFIDGQLSDEEAALYPFVFNSVNEAAEHLIHGSEEAPMVLNIAPYVYWIDDPDDPAIRMPVNGSGPYGLIIECEWLRFYGLSDLAGNVVLACNRGQTIGSRGNFTLFKFSGQGTSSENITFGNYCNIDLEFPLKPELGREKRASAIVQAQLIHCDGDKIVARNTRFVSRLNLCPFVGGKRVLFDRCHFESTDDALCSTGVYLNCTLDFYSSKPFYWTRGTGAVFLNCDIRAFTRGKQYFTKANGQLAILDTRFTSNTLEYIGWRDVPPPEMRNYQYNVSLNKESLQISREDPESTVDLTGKAALDAYRFESKGDVLYNTYNLLCGNDDWDPMGIKDFVLAAEKENGRSYSFLPTQLLLTPTGVSIETNKENVRLNAKVVRFGNYELEGHKVNWSIAPKDEALVELRISGDGKSCNVVPTNTLDEPRQVIVYASTPEGLEAASLLHVAPPKLEAPEFIVLPRITRGTKGVLSLDYRLDMSYEDRSLVSWYRCTDALGSNPIEVAVSRAGKPMLEYELSTGDIGYHMMVSVAPQHIRCDPGEVHLDVMDMPISSKNVAANGKLLYTDFRNVSTRDQCEVLPGFWTLCSFDPKIPGRKRPPDSEKDAWYYGQGNNGAANMTGMLQAQNASLFYTPAAEVKGDMKLSLTVAPFKTAGQGFSIAPLYMDVLIAFDAGTKTGYGLRFIRTTKFHDAVDCVFVKYQNGNITEISEPVSTSCYRTLCHITLEVAGTKLTAQAKTSAETRVKPDRPEVLGEVHMEIDIVPNQFGSFGIQYAGGHPTMIKELKAEWKFGQASLPLLEVSDNQRFLIEKNGNSFFWLGDTGWLLFSKLNREEAKKYIDDRAAKGFNVIQVMVLHNLKVKNFYGDSALVNRDVSKPHLTPGSSFESRDEYDYWDHVDYILKLAEEKGIYMALVPVWGSNVRAGLVSREQADIYSEWLSKRYADKSHIIWLNGGDTRGNDSTETWNIIGENIRENAPDHLITFHPFGRTKSSMWFHQASWLDFNMFQSGHRRYDQDDTELAYGQDNWKYVRDDYGLNPVKPTIDGEPSYEGIPQGLHDPAEPYWNDKDVRRYAYWSVFAGGFGFTYGHSAVMQMHKPGNPDANYGVREYWYEAIDAPGAQQMIHLKNLMLSKPFFERVPDQSIIAGNPGEKYSFLVATKGKNYALVYTYTGRDMTINMGKIAGSIVTASWFNPRNGEISTLGEFENKGVKSFDPPGVEEDGNDWVLILESRHG